MTRRFATHPLFLVALVVLCTIIRAQCGAQCKFRLCRAAQPITFLQQGIPTFIRAPKVASFPFVCRPKKRLGKILRTGEAIIRTAGQPSIPISKWRPKGLSRKFSKSFFRLADIPFSRDSQGIVRSTGKGNYYNFLNGVCVILPIQSYEIIKGRKNKTRTISKSSRKDCISFVTETPELIIDLTWSNSEDLDLIVKGPLGSSGRLASGHVNSSCRGGQETVIFEDAKSGRYDIVYKFRYDENPPRSSRILSARNQLATIDHWHWPSFPFFCFDPPRNLPITSKTVTQSKTIRHLDDDHDRDLPIKDDVKRFQYSVTVTWKGSIIARRSGSGDVGGHGPLGSFNIVCTAFRCSEARTKKSSP